MTKKETAPADLESELGVSASPEDLAAVKTVVLEAINLEQRIEKGETLLKTLKGELNIIKTVRLPDIMARASTSLYRVDKGELEGWKVEIKPVVAGSLPKVTDNDDTPELIAEKKAKREKALDLIREMGAEDIIKTEVTITIEKGQDNALGDLKEKLKELGLLYEVDSGIHPQTLMAFARERLKNGEDVPFEDLGLFAGRAAKITPPKEK